jgi:hypothetical protein
MVFLKALEKTLFHFFSALGFRAVAKKMKVCFVRWSGWAFFTNLFLAFAIQSGVGCCPS